MTEWHSQLQVSHAAWFPSRQSKVRQVSLRFCADLFHAPQMNFAIRSHPL